MQGFPKELADKAKSAAINSNKLLSQAGNAMTVSVISAIGKSLLKSISEDKEKMDVLVKKGSKTAKNGFKNEKEIFLGVCDKQYKVSFYKYE